MIEEHLFYRLASTFELSDEQPKTIRPRARSVPRHGEADHSSLPWSSWQMNEENYDAGHFLKGEKLFDGQWWVVRWNNP